MVNFSIVAVLPFWLEGLWLHFATLQSLIPSFPWIASKEFQGKDGTKFCHLRIQDPKRKPSFTNDVADVCAAAVDDPVVSVEGQLVAHQRAEPGPRRELSGLAAKVLQSRVAAFLKK